MPIARGRVHESHAELREIRHTRRVAKRKTAPPQEPRVTRTTIEVRPSWLEEDPAEGRASRPSKARGSRPSRASQVGRPTYQRVTVEVKDEWLESGSRPPPLPIPPGPRPPPLPQPEPEIDVDLEDDVSRSALPPPEPEPVKKPRR